MELSDFYNHHKGQTCLIAGMGPNLKLTPPEWFNYTSFSVNTIYMYEGWKPTYYAAVDLDMLKLYDTDVTKKYNDVTKFFPRPDFDELQGDNIYRFYHRDCNYWVGGMRANDAKALTRDGIGYKRIWDCVLQLVWHMGFTTVLFIGISHKPETRNVHFWGFEPRDPEYAGFEYETLGLQHFTRVLQTEGVTLLNLSEDTYLPENVMPRDDWRNWKNA